jgi:hypothetical protein
LFDVLNGSFEKPGAMLLIASLLNAAGALKGREILPMVLPDGK